jgi:hypothetical protein
MMLVKPSFPRRNVIPELISTLPIPSVKLFRSGIADERGVYGVGWEEALLVDKSSISGRYLVFHRSKPCKRTQERYWEKRPQRKPRSGECVAHLGKRNNFLLSSSNSTGF